ncbi:MAG: tetratricopeptide repeat protein [Candidatus Omnitrophica bacterium]|nr:tetratricopeptide repeat protein [Candidatus Omnitrophota bacterium]
MQTKLTSKTIIFLLVVFAIAFGLRLVYLTDLMAAKIFPVLENSDSSAYYNWAKDVAAGDIIGFRAFMKWPLYAYFLGAWFKAFGSNLTNIFFLQFFLGALNCVLVFFIARKFFNPLVSCIAALLCLSYGIFIFFDGLIMYTSLSLVLNSLFLLYLFKVIEKPNAKKLFFCGLFLGACVITQASILLFGLCAVLWIIFQTARDNKALISKILIFFCGLLIVIAATTLRNYLAEKDLVPIAGNMGFNFYVGNNPQSTGTFFSPDDITLNQEDMFRDSRIIAEALSGRRLKTSEVSSLWLHRSLDYAAKKPIEFLSKTLKKFLLVFSPKEYMHDIEYKLVSLKPGVLNVTLKDLRFIMPFVFIGLFMGFMDFKKNFILYLYTAAFSFSIALFFVTARYRLALVPVFMIFAAVAIERFISLLKALELRSLRLLVVVWIAIFVVLNYSGLFALPVKSGANSAIFEAHMFNALKDENNSEYSAALSELEQAHKLEPYNRRAISRQGVIYFKLGKLDLAVEQYQDALKVSPLSVDAYYNLGFIYNQQMRFNQAKEMLLKAVSLDPVDFRAHFELGRAYTGVNYKDAARQEYGLALKYINRWRKVDIEIINKELAVL